MMNRLFTYLLLTLFVIQTTSSGWIIASFYANRDYIASNLCINRFDKIPVCRGTCYLNTQLEKNDKKEQKIPNGKEKEIQLFLQQPVTFSVGTAHTITVIKKVPLYRQQPVKSSLLCCVFQPPEMA
ncbi:hypothetical protein ACLI1A_12390 [Flavobacterium sp. RHBU_3]|uniref:hypothetical protein n=1 Tax=Flavobacterium sp. RHBU_3 TaxID=3391184 RepID=UPI00398559CA